MKKNLGGGSACLRLLSSLGECDPADQDLSLIHI